MFSVDFLFRVGNMNSMKLLPSNIFFSGFAAMGSGMDFEGTYTSFSIEVHFNPEEGSSM
jgi:hypothetical protein